MATDVVADEQIWNLRSSQLSQEEQQSLRIKLKRNPDDTQPLDISHGLSAVIEKSLDLESNGAVGQSDIRQYYDSLNLLRVFSFLVKYGLDHDIAAACLRHQLLCSININIGQDVARITSRTRGSLTGSRVAGISARVPVLHLFSQRAESWRWFSNSMWYAHYVHFCGQLICCWKVLRWGYSNIR